METGLLTCPRCKMPIDAGMFNRPEPFNCFGCRSSLQATVFPAFYRPKPAAEMGEPVLDEGEASCYRHPQKRAVTSCEGCGGFVCALCKVEHKGQHLCFDCFGKGIRKNKLPDLDSRRVLFDSLALALAFWPVLLPFLWMFTVITAPAALFVAIRYRKAPLGLLRRSRWRLYVAGLLAVAQLVLLVFLFGHLALEIYSEIQVGGSE